jgi:hypothetical protein
LFFQGRFKIRAVSNLSPARTPPGARRRLCRRFFFRFFSFFDLPHLGMKEKKKDAKKTLFPVAVKPHWG